MSSVHQRPCAMAKPPVMPSTASAALVGARMSNMPAMRRIPRGSMTSDITYSTTQTPMTETERSNREKSF